jgi:hypothetical protein
MLWADQGEKQLAQINPQPRPGAVTGAAVLAFVLGGLLILIHLWTLLAVFEYTRGGVAQAEAGTFTAMYAVLSVRIVLGVLFIWGAFAAMTGRTRTILVIASGLQVMLAVLEAANALVGVRGPSGFAMPGVVFAVLDVIFVVPILVLILQPSSRGFFDARRRATS